MATRTSWKTLYTDLPDHIAEILRSKRLKPDQITSKSDGELLSIEGINDKALESIRTLYPAGLTDQSASVGARHDEPAKETAPKKHSRSIRYQTALKQIDKNKTYPINSAVSILSQISSPKSPGTVELHLNLLETGTRGETKLPHSTGKQIAIEIFSDATIAKLNANQLDFDTLLVRPAEMSKLARFAKLLGPKGLMPNPKNGTITPDPEKRAEELKKGAIFAYKTEPKAPLMHLTLGKINQSPEHLTENIIQIISAIGKLKIKSAFIKTTQSPSIKLDLTSL